MTLSDIKPYGDSLPFHGVVLPTIAIPPEDRAKHGAPTDASNVQLLAQMCRNAFRARQADGRIPAAKVKEYGERVKLELDTIEALGFTNYLLMVWDICRFADEKGIARGPGRGSVSSSLVCHLIGITELDPIANGLFFTRFLSKARAKTKTVNGTVYCDGGLVPDVDMDFDNFRREEIFDYLSTRYPGQTCKTLTTTTFTSKSLIINVLKVFENAGNDVAQAASNLIEKESGVPQEIEDALSDDKDKQNVAFKEWAKDHKETVEIAMGLSGLNHSEGQHASAFLICAYPIADLMPLQSAASDEGGRTAVSGYDMYSAQEVCLKFDILGLKALPLIQQVCDAVGIKPKDIDVHDPAIYREMQDFQRRYGIFQLETFAQGNAAARVKPRDFKQLAACLAIARPGAFAYLNTFVDYVNKGAFASVHPLIDDILRPTGGVCVYQEQTLAMLKKVGMTDDDAEWVRKCVTGDTMFLSKSRGWITIDCLLKDGYKKDLFLVMDGNGKQCWKHIANIWSTGKKQAEYVRARNGMWVRATGWHQFLTAEGWKAKKYLSEDDFLVCTKSIDYDGEDRLSLDWAIVLGGIITEGWLVARASHATFTNWDKELMDRFCQSFDAIFGPNRLRLSDGGRVANIRIAEKRLIEARMLAGKSATKKLPEEMMGMTKETTANFLGYMFSCEATVTDQELSFTSASYRLIQQVQLLLLRFGVRSNLILKYNREHNRDYYVLHIGQHDDLIRFHKTIGQYMCSAKRTIIDQRIAQPCPFTHTTDVIPANLMNQFVQQYGLAPTAGGRAYRANVSMERFKRLVSERAPKDRQWTEFAHGKQEFTKVESFHDLYGRDVPTYDFTVDDDTPFIVANGLVIHNCIGKKLKDKVPEAKAKITEACERNNRPKEITDLLLKIMQDSGGYAFNASHAFSYSIITARCLYLKLHHPLQFYWSLLRMARHESDHLEKAGIIESEMRTAGYKLLPPSFSASMDFQIEGKDSVRFALGMVRGISDKNLKLIATFLGNGGLPPGTSKFAAFQALSNAGLNLPVMASLTQAGCLSDYETYTALTLAGKPQSYRSRSRLVLELCTWNLLHGKNEKANCISVGDKPEVRWDVLKAIRYLVEQAKDEKGKPLMKESRFLTIKKHYDPYKEIYEMNSRNERLANFWYERRALGFSYSESLRSIFGDYIDGLLSVEEARKLPRDTKCRLIGFVSDPYKGKTKKGNAEFRFELKDETGAARIKAFNDVIGAIESQNGRLPEESDIVVCNVKHMSDGTFFITRGLDGTYCGIQTSKIFMRLSELKDKHTKEPTASIPI